MGDRLSGTSDRDLEERLERLERLVDRAVTLANQHPIGRAVLKKLGISP